MALHQVSASKEIFALLTATAGPQPTGMFSRTISSCRNTGALCNASAEEPLESDLDGEYTLSALTGLVVGTQRRGPPSRSTRFLWRSCIPGRRRILIPRRPDYPSPRASLNWPARGGLALTKLLIVLCPPRGPPVPRGHPRMRLSRLQMEINMGLYRRCRVWRTLEMPS